MYCRVSLVKYVKNGTSSYEKENDQPSIYQFYSLSLSSWVMRNKLYYCTNLKMWTFHLYLTLTFSFSVWISYVLMFVCLFVFVSGSNWYIWRVSFVLHVTHFLSASFYHRILVAYILQSYNSMLVLLGVVQVLQLRLFQNNLKEKGYWKGIEWWMLP